MSWSLAPNLVKRSDAIRSCYPRAVIYSIGDTAHMAEHSDHNPDARGLVHAIDVMFAAGTPQAVATLRWLLADPADLEYVIHNDRIYRRTHGWANESYKTVDPGRTDPHTNHIHVSGKHGTAGSNAATGTGYDRNAEATIPPGSPCTSEDDVGTVDTISQKALDQITAAWGTKLLGRSGPVRDVALQSGFGYVKAMSPQVAGGID